MGNASKASILLKCTPQACYEPFCQWGEFMKNYKICKLSELSELSNSMTKAIIALVLLLVSSIGLPSTGFSANSSLTEKFVLTTAYSWSMNGAGGVDITPGRGGFGQYICDQAPSALPQAPSWSNPHPKVYGTITCLNIHDPTVPGSYYIWQMTVHNNSPYDINTWSGDHFTNYEQIPQDIFSSDLSNQARFISAQHPLVIVHDVLNGTWSSTIQ
jgi:hypothetical protein